MYGGKEVEIIWFLPFKFSIFFVLIVVLCICRAINSQRKTKSNLWYGSVRVVPDKLQLVC